VEHGKGGEAAGRANTDILARRLGPEGLALAGSWGDPVARLALADLLEERGLPLHARACREAYEGGNEPYETGRPNSPELHWYDAEGASGTHPESDLPSDVYKGLSVKSLYRYAPYETMTDAVLDMVRAWAEWLEKQCSKKP